MVTGFDILGHNRKLRRHWLCRIYAILVDMAIVFISVGIVLLYLGYDTILLSGITASVAFFLYSAILEAATGKTIGKRIFRLKARPLKKGKKPGRLFLRNLSKLLWFIALPIDVIVGLAGRGDPRQRFSDRLLKTTVVHRREPDFHGRRRSRRPKK